MPAVIATHKQSAIVLMNRNRQEAKTPKQMVTAVGSQTAAH